MSQSQPKPKLLYFQQKYDARLPEFLLIHKNEHVKCLSEFFEVTVISTDCDYQQVCDTYTPDIVLFESGVPFGTNRRPKITNITACPEIPRAGILNADAFSEGRSGFLSDMEHLRVETFFAIATAAAEYTPAIVKNLFVWPNCVDPEIYHDYGEWKSIPVLLAGNRGALYPWRQKIARLVSDCYPTLMCPHPGYSPVKVDKQILVGTNYARTINASRFVPTCGTVAKEVVRKHFEIPACKACLVTEDSPALRAAGFVDMKNCVFADEHDVLDKLGYLFAHPEELDAITTAGYDLVHSRHTSRQRDEILQWLTLHKSLKADETIAQDGPFEPLRTVGVSQRAAIPYFSSDGLLSKLIRQGDEELSRGKYDSAESIYLKCLQYYRFMPEPQLRVAICRLRKGDPKTALAWVLKPIQFTLAEYKAIDPDPIEWAYYILTLLCLGKTREACARADEFPWVRRPELDYIRWVTRVIRKNAASPGPLVSKISYRRSVHHTSVPDMASWVDEVRAILKVCGKGRLAEQLTNASGGPTETDEVRQITPTPKRVWQVTEGGSHRDCQRKLLLSNAKLKARRAVAAALHRFEGKYGYVLPYNLSKAKSDEPYRTIQGLVSQESVSSILIIGASNKDRSTMAVLLGAAESNEIPKVFCVSVEGKSQNPQKVGIPIGWYVVPPASSRSRAAELANIIRNIKSHHQIQAFDYVLVESCGIEGDSAESSIVDAEIASARVVVLCRISSMSAYKHYETLLRSSQFNLVNNFPDIRSGYAAFKRHDSSTTSDHSAGGRPVAACDKAGL